MATFSQNQHQLLEVGKNVAKSSNATIAGLADGEIAIYTAGGTKYTEAAASAGANFKIYVGRGSSLEPIVSQVINKSMVTKVTKTLTSAATQKLQYVGYNGSSGSIVVNNNTVYRATLDILEQPETTHGGVYIKDLVYQSDSSATQAEIATGLVKNGIGSFSRETDTGISFKAICNSAVTAANGFVNNITVTKGSKVVSVAAAITWGPIPTTLAAGDFVRMGSNGSGTALTNDVYEVISVDTANLQFTIDRPVQVDSQVLTTATSDAEVITSALGVAADWGIAIVGSALTTFSTGKMLYKVANWYLGLDSDSFGTTPITDSSTPFLGTNVNKQILELEWFTRGNNGEFFRVGEPNIFTQNSMVTAGEDYDAIEIELQKDRNDSLGVAHAPQVVTLTIPTTTAKVASHYALAATADDITDVLEILLTGVPVYGGSVTSNGGALATGDLAIV